MCGTISNRFRTQANMLSFRGEISVLVLCTIFVSSVCVFWIYDKAICRTVHTWQASWNMDGCIPAMPCWHVSGHGPSWDVILGHHESRGCVRWVSWSTRGRSCVGHWDFHSQRVYQQWDFSSRMWGRDSSQHNVRRHGCPLRRTRARLLLRFRTDNTCRLNTIQFMCHLWALSSACHVIRSLFDCLSDVSVFVVPVRLGPLLRWSYTFHGSCSIGLFVGILWTEDPRDDRESSRTCGEPGFDLCLFVEALLIWLSLVYGSRTSSLLVCNPHCSRSRPPMEENVAWSLRTRTVQIAQRWWWLCKYLCRSHLFCLYMFDVANVTVECCRLSLSTWCFVSHSLLVCVSVTTLSFPSVSHFAQCVVMIHTAFVIGTLGFPVNFQWTTRVHDGRVTRNTRGRSRLSGCVFELFGDIWLLLPFVVFSRIHPYVFSNLSGKTVRDGCLWGLTIVMVFTSHVGFWAILDYASESLEILPCTQNRVNHFVNHWLANDRQNGEQRLPMAPHGVRLRANGHLRHCVGGCSVGLLFQVCKQPQWFGHAHDTLQRTWSLRPMLWFYHTVSETCPLQIAWFAVWLVGCVDFLLLFPNSWLCFPSNKWSGIEPETPEQLDSVSNRRLVCEISGMLCVGCVD